MANISTAIQLYDRVSAPINNMLSAINSIVYAFDSVESSMDGAFDSTQIAEAKQQILQAKAEMATLGNEIDDNTNSQRKFNNVVNDGTSYMQNLSSKVMGMVGAYFGLSQIKNVVSDAIEFASDLSEVQNVVDVAFGSSSKEIDKWATTTLESFGLNELSAKRFAGTMGAMLKSSGMAGDKVSKMSMKITELAGDMASFYNLEGEEAFNKLRSGISGETEPLKQLGINMSVANLEAYALSQGIETAYKDMSQGEQVMLRYNYLLQATSDAQGDFARTSDSFANQQKLLTENWKALTGELANNAIPGLSTALNVLNSGLKFMADNITIISPLLGGLVTIVGLYTGALLTLAIVKGVASLMEKIHAAQALLASGATLAEAAAAETATGAQIGLNAALLACPLTWIIILIIAVIAAFYAVIAVINKVTGSTISATGVIVGALMTAVAFIWNLIVGVIDAIIQIVWTLVEPIIGVVEWILNICNGGFNSFGDAVANLIGQIISWFLSLGKVVTKIIDAIFGTNWTEGLNSLQDKVLAWGKNENAITLSREAPTLESMTDGAVGRWAYSDAYKTGYEWGASIGAEDSFNVDDLLNQATQTAENTGKTADALEITNEDLKYMKDLAERDVINRFTTAEIKVDMTNNNTINKDMDLDGIVDYLTTGVNEAMEKAAEGVHT